MLRTNLKRIATGMVVLASVAMALPGAAFADPPEGGRLYHDGDILRTFVVPAPVPHGGIDPLYMVTNGVNGQLGITAVAPGSPGYHGGRWAVYLVTFNVTPYLLTSDEDV